MMWKDYPKLSKIASYSKLARASKAPPPPQGRIGLKKRIQKICTDDNSKFLYPNKNRFYFLIDFAWTTPKKY